MSKFCLRSPRLIVTAFCGVIFFGSLLECDIQAQIVRKREFRMWENRAGKKISATLSYVKDGNVLLKLANGRDASVPIDSLSDRDQEYLKELKAQGLAQQVRTMPSQTKIDKNVKVEERPNSAEGGVPVFLTPHFEFHNDSAVSKAFVMEASRIFEGTYAALSALPLGLDIKTPEGMSHFKTSFQTGPSFQQTLSGTSLAIPRGNVAGVYISKLKAVFVPYSQMGVKRSGSKMSLRKSSDTSTLIHEITHQLMHDWIQVTPLWMSEGLAEYVSAIPYQSGRFDFKNAERGFKEGLKKRGMSKRITLPDPMTFLKEKSGVKSGDAYAYSMVYVYYFMHLDRPEAPGASLAAYLQLLGEGRDNTQKLITEFNDAVDDYNGQINAYNKEFAEYREQAKSYKKELDDFNARVDKHNDLVNQGVDPKGKVEIGTGPTPPTPPKAPVIPDVLAKVNKMKEAKEAAEKEKEEMAEKESPELKIRTVSFGGGKKEKEKPEIEPLFDVYKAANKKAFPSLLRGRDFEQLKADMIKKFDQIGMEISFRS